MIRAAAPLWALLLAACDHAAPAAKASPAVPAAPAVEVAPAAPAASAPPRATTVALPAPGCAEAECLPAFRTTTIDGQPMSTDDLRGKPVLVMVWASWCEPCVAKGATISSLYRSGAGRFAVLALSRDEADDAALRRFRDRYKLSYPIARISDGDPTFAAFGSPTDVPTFLLYGRDGQRVARFTGALPTDVLERELARLE